MIPCQYKLSNDRSKYVQNYKLQSAFIFAFDWQRRHHGDNPTAFSLSDRDKSESFEVAVELDKNHSPECRIQSDNRIFTETENDKCCKVTMYFVFFLEICFRIKLEITLVQSRALAQEHS